MHLLKSTPLQALLSFTQALSWLLILVCLLHLLRSYLIDFMQNPCSQTIWFHPSLPLIHMWKEKEIIGLNNSCTSPSPCQRQGKISRSIGKSLKNCVVEPCSICTVYSAFCILVIVCDVTDCLTHWPVCIVPLQIYRTFHFRNLPLLARSKEDRDIVLPAVYQPALTETQTTLTNGREQLRELASYPILSPHTTQPGTLTRARRKAQHSVLSACNSSSKALMDVDTYWVYPSQSRGELYTGDSHRNGTIEVWRVDSAILLRTMLYCLQVNQSAGQDTSAHIHRKVSGR